MLNGTFCHFDLPTPNIFTNHFSRVFSSPRMRASQGCIPGMCQGCASCRRLRHRSHALFLVGVFLWLCLNKEDPKIRNEEPANVKFRNEGKKKRKRKKKFKENNEIPLEMKYLASKMTSQRSIFRSADFS